MVGIEVAEIMLRIFYIILTSELFFGGGGRLLEIGSGTLRMLLFSIAIGLTLLPQFWRNFNGEWLRTSNDAVLAFFLITGFVVVHLFGIIVGIANGIDVDTVFREVQPLLFWLAAPFFAHVLSQREYIELTSKLVRIAGFVMAVAYLVTLAGFLTEAIDFTSTYQQLSSTGEFMFRGNHGVLFYKGFIYLCIALVFTISIGNSKKYLLVLVISSAIVLTLTRGFILSSALATLLLLLANRKWKTFFISLLVSIVIAALVSGYFSQSEESMFSRNEEQLVISNQVRINDMKYMLEQVDTVNLLIGHGFGSLISGDRLNIENSFLWIWWKMGIIGLIFWLTPLLLSFIAYLKIPLESKDFTLACAYFFSVVLIYFQTAMNPYLTNPIGLSFVMIAMFSLRSLARFHLNALGKNQDVRLNPLKE